MHTTIFGEHEQRVIDQLDRCVAREEGSRGVLCADGHLGYSAPIGGVVAYREHVSPAAVGYDIGCGNLAVRTDLREREILPALPGLMDRIYSEVSFGVGRRDGRAADHPIIDAIRAADFEPQRALAGDAAKQLGTVGAGNHYVDLFAGEDGSVWVGVHFGSRGFGHRTASGFLALAKGLPFEGRVPEGEMQAPPDVLSVHSDLGQGYLAAMELAGEYAHAGREVVVDQVLTILGARALEEVHNHHNYCLPGDALVATADGPCRIDEMTRGAVVFAAADHGTEPTIVLDRWASGVKPIYAIRTASRKLRCSGEHPIRVVTDGVLGWKAAMDLALGDEIVCARGYYPQDVSWGEDKARFVGAFLGDGWIRHEGAAKRGYAVGLAIGTAADEHSPKYLALSERVAPNAGWGGGWALDRAGHFGLSCSARSVYDAIVEMGVAGRSHDKQLPAEAFRLPRHEKLALLAGYFDADGSVADAGTSSHGRGTIASVGERLVRGLRELAIGSGLRATAVRSELRSTNYGTAVVYRCVLAADSVAELPLWHPAKVARKRTTSARRSEGRSVGLPVGLFTQRILAIEAQPAEPVYDLSVAHDSHSFVVEGVVTHNCWLEEHDGERFYVVRKGATPAFPGQRGFVGATMGEPAVILEGLDTPRAAQALHSTVHGAGRAMSRNAAAGRRRKRWSCAVLGCGWVQAPSTHKPEDARCPACGGEGIRKRWVQEGAGAIDWEAAQRELRELGIELRGAAADEAPGAYKRLGEVLAAHEGTVEILHELRPLGVAMAGPETPDPWKD